MNFRVKGLLIVTAALLFCFQNFDAPERVLPVERTFTSTQTNPSRRALEYAEFQMTDSERDTYQKIKNSFRLDWGGNANTDARQPAAVGVNEIAAVPVDPMKYSLGNFNTLRIHNETDQFSCKIQTGGADVTWHHQLSPSSSYGLSYNSQSNRPEANLQISF